MLRLVLFLLVVGAAATGLSWLADRPGSLLVTWQGYEIETSVFRAIVLLTLLVGLSILLWSLARQLWAAPGSIGRFFNRRRHRRGLEALSGGMIAIGAGDRNQATRYAIQARRALPDEPLTHVLRAQAAQLSGDRITARRIFEAMLGSPETEVLGLRGLFLEAERENETAAARQFAERALALNPKLGWPADALFELQCKAADWPEALRTLSIARKHGHIEREVADRRRAVLLTAQAQAAEDADPNRALALAYEAHKLAADLIPAGAIAGRILAARGQTSKAAKVIQRTWKRSPHPDLATAYAYARLGDSPTDRLNRVRQLAALTPHSIEGPIALATAAIDAYDWQTARSALAPLLDSRLTQRIATLMARIEGGEHGDKGRVREWLARAVNAQRDPAWTADGVVSDKWAPVSPVTGALDAFQWRVPVEAAEPPDEAFIAKKLDELLAIGARREPVIDDARPRVPASSAKAEPPAAAPAATPVRSSEAIDVEPSVVAPAPRAAEKQTEPAPVMPAAIMPAAITPAPAVSVPETLQKPAATEIGVAAKPVAAEPRAQSQQPIAKPVTSASSASVMPVSSKAPADPATATNKLTSSRTHASLTNGATGPAASPAETGANSATKTGRDATSMTSKTSTPGRAAQKSSAVPQEDRPRIFVAPRAPDDPGPDEGDADRLPPMAIAVSGGKDRV